MIIPIQNRRAGFSLIELLLTMVLVVCLAAAAVFSFTAIYRSANLDEGMDRFQALIRFAQAEAATTGRKVRLQFEPAEAALETSPELRRIRVTWEADYLTAPGVFQTYSNKAWSEQIVNELVGVEKVQQLGAGALDPIAPADGQQDESVTEFFDALDFPTITFYPDGSCDSAEVVLASLNPDDARRLAVRISGVLGTMSSRTVAARDEPALLEEEEFPNETIPDDFDPSLEPSTPVASFGE